MAKNSAARRGRKNPNNDVKKASEEHSAELSILMPIGGTGESSSKKKNKPKPQDRDVDVPDIRPRTEKKHRGQHFRRNKP